MTEEIERMMTELTTLCNKGNSLPTTRPPAPAATTVLPKLLLKAETMQAHSEYAGPDWKHLLILPGDTIIVYAHINEVAAVGFNTRTNLGGRFSIDAAKKVEPQPHVELETFLCVVSTKSVDSNPSYLAYNRGQYIRVCRWEKGSRWAYCFNHSTLNMVRICIFDGLRMLSGMKKPEGFYQIR